jgi:hypothetical protein
LAGDRVGRDDGVTDGLGVEILEHDAGALLSGFSSGEAFFGPPRGVGIDRSGDRLNELTQAHLSRR